MRPPSPFSALPPVIYIEASPKAISGRTSYLRVRLEFLRYPQLIPAFFNIRLVRSSTTSYRRFNLSMDRSPGFGSTACNSNRPFQTRFPCGSGAERLNLAAYSNSPARSTKSTRSLSLPLLVNTGFQVLFHSPPGVLFTFPSRYYSLSVTKKYLALGGGPPCFPPDSSCPVVLWISAASFAFRSRGFYPLRRGFPAGFNYTLSVTKSYLALGGGPPCFPPDSSCPVVLRIPTSQSAISLTGLLPCFVLFSKQILL